MKKSHLKTILKSVVLEVIAEAWDTATRKLPQAVTAPPPPKVAVAPPVDLAKTQAERRGGGGKRDLAAAIQQRVSPWNEEFGKIKALELLAERKPELFDRAFVASVQQIADKPHRRQADVAIINSLKSKLQQFVADQQTSSMDIMKVANVIQDLLDHKLIDSDFYNQMISQVKEKTQELNEAALKRAIKSALLSKK